MRISVGLAADDVAYLDEYASRNGLRSRSEVIRRAIRLLRTIDIDRIADLTDDPPDRPWHK